MRNPTVSLGRCRLTAADPSARRDMPRRAAQRTNKKGAHVSIGTDAETKKKIIAEYATAEGDTGSPGVRGALLWHRISHLTEHLKQHKHDHHSRRGLLLLVGQRRGLLNSLEKTEMERYRSVVSPLGLRR